jgi:hypothetical protein
MWPRRSRPSSSPETTNKGTFERAAWSTVLYCIVLYCIVSPLRQVRSGPGRTVVCCTFCGVPARGAAGIGVWGEGAGREQHPHESNWRLAMRGLGAGRTPMSMLRRYCIWQGRVDVMSSW